MRAKTPWMMELESEIASLRSQLAASQARLERLEGVCQEALRALTSPSRQLSDVTRDEMAPLIPELRAVVSQSWPPCRRGISALNAESEASK